MEQELKENAHMERSDVDIEDVADEICSFAIKRYKDEKNPCAIPVPTCRPGSALR